MKPPCFAMRFGTNKPDASTFNYTIRTIHRAVYAALFRRSDYDGKEILLATISGFLY